MLGVPFGTFVGQTLGWRASFWIVAALGVASLAGIAAPNIGAFNVSNAGGAWLGGLALGHGLGLDALPWVAAAVSFAALVVTWLAARLDARGLAQSAAATVQ